MVKRFSVPGCWFRPPVRRYQAHDHDGRRGLGPVLPSANDTHVMTTMLNTRSLVLIPPAGGPMAVRRDPLFPRVPRYSVPCCWLATGRPPRPVLTPLALWRMVIPHSERGCGIPASRARTSVSRYRRWPPRVRIDVSFPAFAQRVTVLGSTRNMVATSAGVSSGSASGVRADMGTASPSWTVLRSCVVAPPAPPGACRGCPIWPTETILPSPAVTSRPPGAKILGHIALIYSGDLHNVP